MGDKLRYNGVDYEFSRRFGLGGELARTRSEDIVRLDSGRRVSFSRRVPERMLRIVINLADRADRATLEQFFYYVSRGRQRTFDVIMTGAWREVIRAGAVIDGNVITCGMQLNGQTIKCGQWATQDTYTYQNCRFEDSALAIPDIHDENTDLEFTLVQELES